MAAESIRTYEFTQVRIQKAGAAQSGTSATDTATAGAVHGLALHDIVVFTALGDPAAGVTANTRYFVVDVGSTTQFKVSATKSGSPITLGTAGGTTPFTFRKLEETVFPWANQASADVENTSYTWEGDAQQAEITLLRGITVSLDHAAIPADGHAAVFGKTAITGPLPGGGTSAYGYGGGGDVGGASVGLRLEGFAVVRDGGVDRTVTFVRWYPQGTLTFRQTSAFQTGQAGGITGYAFSPTRTNTDIVGATIAGAPAAGDFYFDYEIG
jgi:hypothetical protein